MALQLHINVSLNRPPTARGVAHLVVHGTSGSTGYETIPPFVRLETSGGVLSTVDMVVMMMILLVWQPIGWISYKQSTV